MSTQDSEKIQLEAAKKMSQTSKIGAKQCSED
jgi:hypothetical protein